VSLARGLSCAGGSGGVNVGYLTAVSVRKVSMSRGDDLMGAARRWVKRNDTCEA
jgi:hypothetical protein